MRRITLILLSFILIAALCMPVWAANYASALQINANVNGDESCMVTIMATFHIEENDGEIYFPVPLEASAVTLNGTRVRTTRTRQARKINLSKLMKNMTGDFTVTISYYLPDVIETGAAGTPELQLPLLSGYEEPVSQLDFTVTMPSQVTGKPAFSSGYHQAGIEEYLSCTVDGNTIKGTSTSTLNDHETLVMTVDADPEVFTIVPLEIAQSSLDDIGMIVCGVLAILYWMLFLRAMPRLPHRYAAAPEGVSAGEIGAVMTLGKADLSLMTLSWAQMGYLQIQVGKKAVTLQKRMDMGNERSGFEQRCFKKLFDRRSSVDTSSLFYANLCRAVRKMQPELQSLVKPKSGNMLVFRGLAALIGLFGGVAFALVMTADAALPVLGILALAAIGGICGWFMQLPVSELFLRKTNQSLWGLFFTVIWFVFGIIAGQFNLALTVLLIQWLAGAMAFYGGRRSQQGRLKLSQIMGLRRYLLRISRDELEHILKNDPEYFHNLAPYAIALGVGDSFAAKLGKRNYVNCPYILQATEKSGSAAQWHELMTKILSDMNRRSRLLPLERLAGIVASARNARPERPRKKQEETE